MPIYIRHIYEGKREISETTDVFVPIKEPHQDVLRYSCMSQNKSIIYTWGKQVFPDKCSISNSHQRWTVICVVEGVLLCGNEPLNAGDFVVVPLGCPHTLASKNDSVLFYWCTTNDDILIDVLSMCGYRGTEIMSGHLDEIEPVIDIFENTLYRFPDGCHRRTFLISAFSSLISFLSKDNGAMQMQRMSEQLFNRCVTHIEYTHGNITVDYLAKRYFISRRYLHAMFRQYKDISPIDYILQVRMKAADSFLVTTDFSISKIAELTGYSDYNHFTRAYKKYFGILPSKRRKQVRTESGETDGQV